MNMGNEKQKTRDQNFYEIEVKGLLDQQWAEFFDGFTIEHLENANSLLTGNIQDQSALHGVLAKIRDLGLTLIRLTETDKTLTSGKRKCHIPEKEGDPIVEKNVY